MLIGDALGREMRVAFSKRAQPVWFRLAKWALVIAVTTRLWRGPYFWWWIIGAPCLGVAVHLIWRWKTKAWTQPWGGWDDLAAGSHKRSPQTTSIEPAPNQQAGSGRLPR